MCQIRAVKCVYHSKIGMGGESGGGSGERGGGRVWGGDGEGVGSSFPCHTLTCPDPFPSSTRQSANQLTFLLLGYNCFFSSKLCFDSFLSWADYFRTFLPIRHSILIMWYYCIVLYKNCKKRGLADWQPFGLKGIQWSY